MKHKWVVWTAAVIVALIVAAGVAAYLNQQVAQRIAGFTIDWFRYLNAPAGTLETQLAPGFQPSAAPPLNLAAYDTGNDWPSYNKTLTSNRFRR